jgi:hypothetical protein
VYYNKSSKRKLVASGLENFWFDFTGHGLNGGVVLEVSTRMFGVGFASRTRMVAWVLIVANHFTRPIIPKICAFYLKDQRRLRNDESCWTTLGYSRVKHDLREKKRLIMLMLPHTTRSVTLSRKLMYSWSYLPNSDRATHWSIGFADKTEINHTVCVTEATHPRPEGTPVGFSWGRCWPDTCTTHGQSRVRSWCAGTRSDGHCTIRRCEGSAWSRCDGSRGLSACPRGPKRPATQLTRCRSDHWKLKQSLLSLVYTAWSSYSIFHIRTTCHC